jgi:3-methyladenine DNA glycosylase AlkD
MEVQAYINGIEALFQSRAIAEEAAPMSKYMRNQFEFLGLKSVPRKDASKEYWNQNGIPDEDDLDEFARSCWISPYREVQYFAMDTIQKTRKQWNDETYKTFEFMVCNKSWWDTVDFISSNLVGKWFLTHPEKGLEVIDRYNSSDNMWLNRVSIIFQLSYKEETHWDLMQNNIVNHLASEEFFIQKAIGWALRQYAKTNAAAVSSFVEEHRFMMKPLSIKEALKHLH